MKHEWIARAKRFATYALVGCFDTGMDWVAFTTAHELLHFTPMLCQAIGYAVGTVCSYFLNGRITFRDGHGARWRQCARFAAWNVVSLALSDPFSDCPKISRKQIIYSMWNIFFFI